MDDFGGWIAHAHPRARRVHAEGASHRGLRRRALCTALAATLAASGVATAAPPSAEPLDRTPAAPVRGDAADGAAAQTSAWTVVPGLSAGINYDSNVFATRDDEQSDLFATVAPSLSVRRQGEGGSFGLNAGGNAARYRTYSDENSDDYWLDATGSLRTNRRGELFGGVGYDRLHEDRTSPDDVFGTTPTVYSDTHSHFGIAQGFGEFSLRTGVTYNHLRFRNVKDAAGNVIDNADRNRSVLGYGLRFNYALTPVTELFVQGTLDRRRYDRSVDDSGFRRDSQGSGWAIGLARSGQGKLLGEVYAGRLSQRYDDPALPDVEVPDVGASLTWRPSTQTTLTAYLERSIEETTLPGASTYLDTLLGVRVDRRISARLAAKLALDLTRSDFRGIARRDDLADAVAGFSYRLTRFVYLDADYHLLQRHSDEPAADYYRNALYLGLRVDGGAGPLAERAASTGAASRVHDAPGGFYLGTAAGYEVLDTRVSGSRGGHGDDGGDFGAGGPAADLFAGYGLRFGRAYAGVEAELGRTRAGWRHDKTPDSRIYSADEHDAYALALRLGYVLPDASLLYASVGRERSGFDSTYVPEGSEAFAEGDKRMGTSYGAGLDVPLSAHTFLRARYDVTRYDGYDVEYGADADRFGGDGGRFLIGLGWRLGGAASRAPTSAVAVSGFYGGAHGGDDRSGSRLDATHRQPGPPPVTQFRADFGNHGLDYGVFAGYGHAFGRLYAGAELEIDASGSGWFHNKQPGGRDFSVEAKGSYGASLRLGYVAHGSALVYLRAGRVRSRFNTEYVKGRNADAWIDRDDTRGGTRFGIGVEAPLSASTFVRFDYTVTRYAAIAFSTTQDKVDDVRFANRQHLFRIGLGMRF